MSILGDTIRLARESEQPADDIAIDDILTDTIKRARGPVPRATEDIVQERMEAFVGPKPMVDDVGVLKDVLGRAKEYASTLPEPDVGTVDTTGLPAWIRPDQVVGGYSDEQLSQAPQKDTGLPGWIPRDQIISGDAATPSYEARPKGVLDRVSALKETPEELLPFIGTGVATLELANISAAAYRLYKDEATQEDLALLEDFSNRG